MILINRTYTIVTPESAEEGDFAETGFLSADEPCTFREVVDLMREHINASRSRCTGDIWEWYSTEPEVDYEDGSTEQRGLHYSHNNHPKAAKYWRWAAIAAGHARRT